MRPILITALLVGFVAQGAPDTPRRYVAYRAEDPLVIDGRLDEQAWIDTDWTDAFVDIQGDERPPPRFVTRAKMLWDESFFYVAAELSEPHLWATLTERDSVIYHDNDFEVFIDPTGDTHAYYELEVNALGTVWDLMLLKPYRDGGLAIDAWDIQGLQVGVDLRGTLNDPNDEDDGWSVEIAMPWSVLDEAASHRGAPEPGEIWRVNFSRVQWRLDAGDRGYTKQLDPATDDPYPEDNWVWSPQGAVNMHRPEHWGFVRFSQRFAGSAMRDVVVVDPNEPVRMALREIYYRQSSHFETTGTYASSLAELGVDDLHVEGLEFAPRMRGSATGYTISAAGFGGATVFIRDDGKVWSTQ